MNASLIFLKKFKTATLKFRKTLRIESINLLNHALNSSNMKIKGKSIINVRKEKAQLRKLGRINNIGLEKRANTTTKLSTIETIIQYTKATKCRCLNGLIMTPKKANKIEHAIDRFKPKVKAGTIGCTKSCKISKISSEIKIPMSKKDAL